MLSILIPNFDENVTQLVRDLHAQASALDTSFEILICDQADSTRHFKENDALNQLENVRYFKWNERMGRAANRNHLADEAKGEWIFFIDSDAAIIEEDSLQRFWNAKHWEAATCGTMYYHPTPPEDSSLMLRWKFGREREMRSPIERSRNPYNSFISFAFLIGKDSFNKVRFNEKVVEYGHEDTLFGKQLDEACIRPMHIDVNILHIGLIPGEAFLEKVRQSNRSLKVLVDNGLANEGYNVYKWYLRLKKTGMAAAMRIYFSRNKSKLEAHLLGEDPSLRKLDIYKLGYFCELMS